MFNQAQQFSAEMLQEVIDAIPNAVLLKDRNHRWILVNQTLCREMGKSRSELLNGTDSDFLPADQAKEFWAGDDEVFATGEPREYEVMLRTVDDKPRIVVIRKRLVHLPDLNGDRTPAVIVVIVDVTRFKEAEARARYLAQHDSLTKVPNRGFFCQRLESALDDGRQSGGKFALLVLDLDGFKNVNDRLGHIVGDQVLCITGERLTANVRRADTAARLGGDEFGILQLANDQPSSAIQLAERISGALSEPMEILGKRIAISSSIGISVFPEHGLEAQHLINRADRALYAVKYAGKAGHALFEPEMDAAWPNPSEIPFGCPSISS